MVGESSKGIEEKLVCDRDCCTACGACVSACPKQCIEIQENEFYEGVAIINSSECVHCGLCKKVCPNFRDDVLSYPLKVYAGWRKNTTNIDKCSSGGIATLLSEYLIDMSGVVYGVTSDNGICRYIRATTFDEIEKLKGSKYVFVSGVEIYKDIYQDLLALKKIMVIGTPCYIAGLRSYLTNKGIDTSNLILVDFLCHGTVPHEYLSEQLNILRNRYDFDEVCFRSNIKSENYYLTLKKAGQNVYKQKAENNCYFYSFLNSISTKECCLSCRYHQVERSGDITIGDFIGLGMEIPFDKKSPVLNTSLVLINTKKGEQVLTAVSNNICLFERPLEEAIKGGPSLKKHDNRTLKRKRFRKYVKVIPFIKAVYISVGLEIMKNRIKYFMKKIIKEVV